MPYLLPAPTSQSALAFNVEHTSNDGVLMPACAGIFRNETEVHMPISPISALRCRTYFVVLATIIFLTGCATKNFGPLPQSDEDFRKPPEIIQAEFAGVTNFPGENQLEHWHQTGRNWMDTGAPQEKGTLTYRSIFLCVRYRPYSSCQFWALPFQGPSAA